MLDPSRAHPTVFQPFRWQGFAERHNIPIIWFWFILKLLNAFSGLAADALRGPDAPGFYLEGLQSPFQRSGSESLSERN